MEEEIIPVGENYDMNRKMARVVSEIAARQKVKPSQIALAWLLHKGEDIVPIPGTKRLQYLEENVSSAEIVMKTKMMLRVSVEWMLSFFIFLVTRITG